jgi:hypothetical protein
LPLSLSLLTKAVKEAAAAFFLAHPPLSIILASYSRCGDGRIGLKIELMLDSASKPSISYKPLLTIVSVYWCPNNYFYHENCTYVCEHCNIFNNRVFPCLHALLTLSTNFEVEMRLHSARRHSFLSRYFTFGPISSFSFHQVLSSASSLPPSQEGYHKNLQSCKVSLPPLLFFTGDLFCTEEQGLIYEN